MPRPPQKTEIDEDARLMVQVRKGSQKAFVRLCERQEAPLLAFFRRMGADSHTAEDAVQETLIRVFRFRDRYEPRTRFSSFLFTLARNVWVDALRRRARNPSVDACTLDGPLPPSSQRNPDLGMDLTAALDQLSAEHRMVLVLSVFHGLLYREIGEIMGVPEGTVKSRVFHGLRKLRVILEHVPLER